MAAEKRKLQVLLVDDSALVRETLTRLLESDPAIQVAATASDPYIAARKMTGMVPDVVILDVEMPRMDGITFLKKIMSQHPLPVIICSSLTVAGGDLALQALDAGAVEVIPKPRVGTKRFLEESRVRIVDAVKAAAMTQTGGRKIAPTALPEAVVGALGAPTFATTEKVVVIGASTGGTEALRVFLQAFPPDSPGMAVVQHMPEHFTASLARRLDSLCGVTVKEAENGDPILRGRVLIAPGNRHMMLKRSGTRYYVELSTGPLVSRHRPSVDVLFCSAARHAGKNAIGVIMTGMGADGARGMAEMKEAGAANLAQDEATCVVFGMPAEAIKRGAVDQVLPLERLAEAVIRLADGTR